MEATIEKTADKALELLRALADKLGTTAEQLWPYFLLKVRYEATAWLVAWLLIGAVVALSGLALRRTGGYGEEMVAGGTVLIIFPTIASILALAYNVPRILNPLPYTVEAIILWLSQMKHVLTK